MATALKVNDSSTWRSITVVKVNDSGTWRTITSVKVNDAGTWRTVFSSSSSQLSASGVAGVSAPYVGYILAVTGTMSPTTTPDGKSVIGAADGSGVAFQLTTSGYSSDPGQTGWYTSVTINGGTPYTFASASSYSYNSGAGQAQWTWGGAPAGFTPAGAFTLVVN